MTVRILRDNVVRAIRARYLVGCISDLHREAGEPHAFFEGDWIRGSYVWNNNQGAHISVRWDAPAMVGLVYNKESRRTESYEDVAPEDYQPLRYLKMGLPKDCLPEYLEPLAYQAAAEIDNLVTAGFWTASGPIVKCTGNETDTRDWFHLLDPEPQLNGDEHNLDPDQTKLVLLLADARSQRELVDAEREILFRSLPSLTSWGVRKAQLGANQAPRLASDERLAQLRDALARAEIIL